MFFSGSLPTLNLVIPPGLSFKWKTVKPRLIFSSNLYSALAPDNHLVWKLNKSAFSNEIVISCPEDKIAGFIYIGSKNKDPKERTRPNKDDYVSYY